MYTIVLFFSKWNEFYFTVILSVYEHSRVGLEINAIFGDVMG